MIMFCQPNDYRYQGRNVWVNPEDIVSVESTESNAYSECRIALRDGRSFTLNGNKKEIADKINSALGKDQ